MSAYESLAACYDELTYDIRYEKGGCLFPDIRIKGNQAFYTAEIEIAVTAFYR